LHPVKRNVRYPRSVRNRAFPVIRRMSDPFYNLRIYSSFPVVGTPNAVTIRNGRLPGISNIQPGVEMEGMQ